MEFKEVIRKRESVRSFLDKPIPDEKLRNVLEAARLAPSGSNRQDMKLIVVRDAKKREALAHAAHSQHFVGEAPVVIVAVSTNPERVMHCEVPSYAMDIAIAVDHMTLAAVDEGLGTCWIGLFSQEQVKNIVGIPDKYKVATLFPLGFPKKERGVKSRKPFDDIVYHESFEG